MDVIASEHRIPARQPTEVTVIGGGLAGLIAATEVAEAGVAVRLLDARQRLGGRAISTPAPYIANLGPHALYTNTLLWEWLRKRNLHQPASQPRNLHLVLRWQGERRRIPPWAITAGLRLPANAPVDVDLRTWATERFGVESAQALAGASGAATFDHDPGRLSAAFVVERLRRILLKPLPVARYVGGGWSALVERVAKHAREAGVQIELGSPVDGAGLDDLAARGPVIVAVEPGAARRLLGDAVALAPARQVGLLDVGLTRGRPRDPYLVIDLDEAAFSTRPSAIVPSLAPEGHDVIQVSMGMRPGESLDEVEQRLEAVWDVAMPGWQTRVVWRRRSAVRDATGAVDLPGQTWRDRPPVAHADGVWLAGDWVAAPGHLAEVSANSAIHAAAGAVAAVSRTTEAAASAD